MTRIEDLPIRSSLKGKKPYGAPTDPVPIALNVNENTHDLPDVVIRDLEVALSASLSKLNRYPDREATELRQLLAGYLGHGLQYEQVWAANGSNEILQQILQAFGGPGRTLMSFTPTYSMYPLLSDLTGTQWLAIDRPENYDLEPKFVVDEIQKAKPDIVILCGPNNPTGTKLSHETIVAAYDAFDGMLIVDEAYAEFDSGSKSAVSLLAGRPRLLISRTMSKAFGFAGVRLGYLAADSAVIDALRIVRLPYHLSELTQSAAKVAIKHAPQMLQTVTQICEQRDRLADALSKLGLHVFDSGANFLLVKGFKDPKDVFQRLKAKGILVRDLDINNTLRITAGTEAETTALIEAMQSMPDILL